VSTTSIVSTATALGASRSDVDPPRVATAGVATVERVPGRLITIEGVDGAGKTTLARLLVPALARRGVPVRLLREPGGVATSEAIRRLVTDPALRVGARTEALLYAAARAQLVEELLAPTLATGEWVLLDRFLDSSLAYQGGARGLGIETVRQMNAAATQGLVPDRTLLLDLDAVAARQRARGRDEDADRLEREDDQFFERIRQAYLELAAAEPRRIQVLDAAAAPEAVLSQALSALSDLL
jgi:dTMP kinase